MGRVLCTVGVSTGPGMCMLVSSSCWEDQWCNVLASWRVSVAHTVSGPATRVSAACQDHAQGCQTYVKVRGFWGCTCAEYPAGRSIVALSSEVHHAISCCRRCLRCGGAHVAGVQQVAVRRLHTAQEASVDGRHGSCSMCWGCPLSFDIAGVECAAECVRLRGENNLPHVPHMVRRARMVCQQPVLAQ